MVYPGTREMKPAGQLDPRLVEAMSEILAPGGVAYELGFTGIAGHAVADIGCGLNGDYVRLWEDLGARSILAVDPMLNGKYREIASIKNSVSIQAEIFWRYAQDLGDQNNNTIDTAFIFNIYPWANRSDTLEVIEAAHRILQPDGQLVLTVAEPASWPSVFDALNIYFDYSAIGCWSESLRTIYPADYKVIGDEDAVFHETLVVGTPL